MTNMKKKLMGEVIKKVSLEKDKYITHEVGMQIIKFGCSMGHMLMDRFSSQLKNQIINEIS